MRIVVLCSICLVLGVVEAAQTSVQGTGNTATFVVRLAQGKSFYFVGEEIPLELEFNGLASQEYSFSTVAPDRSPFAAPERYTASPVEGNEDPLADFYSSQGFVGSILSSSRPLNNTPFVLRVSLNDWVRFTKAGHYRLWVVSSRLERRMGESAPQLRAPPLDLTILPAPTDWLGEQVSRAITILDSSDAAEITRGVSVLRYLASEDAAAVLLSRQNAIGKAAPLQLDEALSSSPARPYLIQQMEEIVDTGGPVSDGFIAMLARFLVPLRLPGVSPTQEEINRRYAERAKVQSALEIRWHEAALKRPRI